MHHVYTACNRSLSSTQHMVPDHMTAGMETVEVIVAVVVAGGQAATAHEIALAIAEAAVNWVLSGTFSSVPTMELTKWMLGKKELMSASNRPR